MLLSYYDKEIINSLINSAREKGIEEDAEFFFDYTAHRQQLFGIYFWRIGGNKEKQGGSIDSKMEAVQDLSKLYQICDKDIVLYGNLIMKLVSYYLKNPNEQL